MCQEVSPIETLEVNGMQVKIFTDSEPWNPRDGDNLGTMVCFHGRYSLGDKHNYRTENYTGWDDLEAALRAEGAIVILPLYLYDHSGITMSTRVEQNWQHAAWDSGRVGFIFVTRAKVQEEYGWKRISQKRYQFLEDFLRNEVKVYDQYLTGDVYGYKVECPRCEEELDSDWGFYGHDWKENGLLDEAEAVLPCQCQEVASP